MCSNEDLAAKNVQELINFSQNLITTASETKASSIILSAPFVRLNESLAKHRKAVGISNQTDALNAILAKEFNCYSKIAAFKHALLVHQYLGSQQTNEVEQWILALKAVIPKQTLPIHRSIQRCHLLINELKSTQSIFLISKLNLNSIVSQVIIASNELQNTQRSIHNDIFVQTEIINLQNSREELEQAVINLFNYGSAIVISNSDPSWRNFLRIVSSTENALV